jgi:hypothetical protein
MAEILGPLGFCLGGMSFILSTVPTAAKFAHNYSEYKQQISGVENRLGLCQAKFSTWETYWNSSSLQSHQTLIRSCITDIQSLNTEISESITKSSPTGSESTAWRKMKERLRRGIFRKPTVKGTPSPFVATIRHALWKKEVLEGWMTRLEKAIDVLEKLFEQDFNARTAGHFSGTLTVGRVVEVKRLESFIGALTNLASDVYRKCASLDKTGAWAVELPPPKVGRTLLDWEITTPVDIELRFSVDQKGGRNEHFCLGICFQEDVPETHTTSAAVADVVQSKIWDKNHPKSIPSGIVCHLRDASAKQTLPLASLLMSRPLLFKDPTWRADRGELVYGILEWSLRLWDTPWFEKLCCSGISMEIGATSDGSKSQLFEAGRHDGCQNQDHVSRLQNLGLVFAQLVLGCPIRPSDTSNDLPYEKMVNGVWERTSRSRINEDILRTGSEPLAGAINFCLRPDPVLHHKSFKYGYLFMFMDQIYRP